MLNNPELLIGLEGSIGCSRHVLELPEHFSSEPPACLCRIGVLCEQMAVKRFEQHPVSRECSRDFIKNFVVHAASPLVGARLTATARESIS